jgi:prophage tail gpP-like protein
MADDDTEFAEVTIGGQIYRDWVSVTVRISMEDVVPRFRLQTIEPSDKELNERFLQIKLRDKVNMKVGGKSLIEGGIVKARQVSFDDTRHAVQVDGMSKSAPIMEASIDRKDVQFQGYKLEALANKILQPLGIKFKVEGNPEHINIPFPNVILYRGERYFEAIDRLARARGVWVWSDGEGNLIAGKSEGGGGADLVEGKNITKASLLEEDPGVSESMVQGQNQARPTYTSSSSGGSGGSSGGTSGGSSAGGPGGSGTGYAREVAEISAKAPIPNGPEGLKRIELADGRMGKDEAQPAANFSAMSIVSTTMRVVVEHQGWFKPGTREFWKLSDMVTVKSPMLFGKDRETQRLRVWSVTWAQSLAGTTTTIELVNEAAFSTSPNRSGNPTFQQSFGGQAEPAQVEPLPQPGQPQ